MNLADFEKYDAALGKDEVDQIENLMVEQINSMTGQRLESVKLYHTLPVAVHKIMLSMKGARVFKRESVEQILSMPFFSKLWKRFEQLTVSNIVTETYESETEEIYFRLVRPLQTSDVGCPHCDFWFHQAYGLEYASRGNTWKCWIPITVEPFKSGLEIYPGASIDIVEYSVQDKKLSCDKHQPALGEPVLVPVQPGDMLIFRDDVIHSGAINEGAFTRSSIEITFIHK